MAEQQFTDEHEAAEADAAEQALPVDVLERDEVPDTSGEVETSLEVNPADAAEQAVPVPVDEDEYR